VLHSSEPVVDFRVLAAESEPAEVLACWAVLRLCEQAADSRALAADLVVQPADFRVLAAASESAEVLAGWAVLRLCEQAADSRALRARSVAPPVDFPERPARSFVSLARVD
jgi:hypothetical protein